MKNIIVAIDGHSSCGKSTMARALARYAGYVYVDTGAMYRAVTLHALRTHCFRPDGSLDQQRLELELPRLSLSFRPVEAGGEPLMHLGEECVEPAIRSMEVAACVSPVAAVPAVRAALVAQQRIMGREGGIVMDGRDIGTVVFPQAELKVFVTASAAVRARRRFDELQAKGTEVSYEEVLRNVEERDHIDSHRADSPLRPAPDALILDNSELSLDQQQAWLQARFDAIVK